MQKIIDILESLNKNLFLLLASPPILLIAIFDYKSLILSWNLGRGGILIGFLFITIEYFDSRYKLLSLRKKEKRNLILAVIVTFVITLFYLLTIFSNLHNGIKLIGKSLNVPLIHSWVWLWDYLCYSSFILILIVLLLGFKGLRNLITGLVYLIGLSVILAVDCFFPYESLGPLQAIVPFILASDAFLLSIFDVETKIYENVIEIIGNTGVFRVAVFWPSAGLHSVLIYSFVMLALLTKIEMKNFKRLIYFVIGSIGTFTINLLRIFLLSAYAAFVTTDLSAWEQFHAIAGELLFLPWITLYIFLIASREVKDLSPHTKAL